MANIKNNVAAQETKRRLIEAAGEVFAEHGFDRATIKEITERAEVSLAAVNYHFSDKAELFHQVMLVVHEAGIAAAKTLVSEGDRSPQDRLHAFVHTFLLLALDPHRPAWHAKLISRKVFDPGGPHQRFMGEFFEPFFKAFESLIGQLVGDPKPSPRKTRLLVDSIMGQCVFYVQNQCIAAKVFPNEARASERVDELADHITQFSLAALRGMRRAPSQ